MTWNDIERELNKLLVDPDAQQGAREMSSFLRRWRDALAALRTEAEDLATVEAECCAANALLDAAVNYARFQLPRLQLVRPEAR
jgi:hypothetical protein